MKRIIYSILISISLISCDKDPQVSDDGLNSQITLKGSATEYLNIRNGNIADSGDPFTLRNIEVKGDSVFIKVSYSGGCRKHSFEIIWSEKFSDTTPPGTGMIIIHDANGDNCEAWLTETLAFSLRELAGSVSFDTICVNILNGMVPSDSLSSGGWDPSDTTGYDGNDLNVVFPQGDNCQVEVTATRVICGAGLYDNLWFALNDSINGGIENFYFRKYLQPVALSEGLKGFVPLQGKKYLIGARIEPVHKYSGAIICLAYPGPSVPVRITCVREIK